MVKELELGEDLRIDQGNVAGGRLLNTTTVTYREINIDSSQYRNQISSDVILYWFPVIYSRTSMLEHHWDHRNLFEIWVVQATEG